MSMAKKAKRQYEEYGMERDKRELDREFRNPAYRHKKEMAGPIANTINRRFARVKA